jgi:hypothetical protein
LSQPLTPTPERLKLLFVQAHALIVTGGKRACGRCSRPGRWRPAGPPGALA